ncbi:MULTISPECIES: SRPBCC family protein [unclassified Microbacterium]|uniref:SRPBCC family protein n=1 Tax=unclassified Microbacterium TaxID=2609290 RepID=UPI00214CBB11|nr:MULTISPECIES: SRPBCC family protein [unclassified Microbacterium]MCR2783019.1 SRPBCC family protein [Microbacterium sp. zg.B96]MDL5352209.1 SRPBCC family protein [Microbacterium sp. zg-YB36]WIM16095.1 SRPBCC family protein [Microbacterium sp. zg-B96]
MAAGNARVMRCTAGDVFATLADGWIYPVWVVGAARMRAVSPQWPQQGAKLQHSVGAWPWLIDDSTEIVEWSPPHRVRLRAKAGPIGRAVVVIDVRERGEDTLVTMGEEPVAGPGRLVSQLIAPLLRARNRESLRRLGFLAEGRRREREAGSQTARQDVPDASTAGAGAQAQADVDGADGAERAVRAAGTGGDVAGDVSTGDGDAARNEPGAPGT